MAKLHSLIRFQRHELDEKRKILLELNNQLELLQNEKQKNLDDLSREKNLAAVDIECARHFPLYLGRMMAKIEKIEQAIQSKLLEIHAATHVVQEAFLEVKKLEVAQANRDQAEEAHQKKVETNILDDIGIETFRRNKGEEQV